MQVAIWKIDMARLEKRPLPDSNRARWICNSTERVLPFFHNLLRCNAFAIMPKCYANS